MLEGVVIRHHLLMTESLLGRKSIFLDDKWDYLNREAAMLEGVVIRHHLLMTESLLGRKSIFLDDKWD